jgi:hypothetical protein
MAACVAREIFSGSPPLDETAGPPGRTSLARPNQEDPMPLMSRRKLIFAATGVAAAAVAPRIAVA